MSEKLPLRFNKIWHWEPKKPQPGQKKFRIEAVIGIGERIHAFPHDGEYHYEGYEDSELDKEIPYNSGELGYHQSLNLQEIINLVKEKGLDPNKVHFTASTWEDNLSLEIVHIRELNESEQLEEYSENITAWKRQQQQQHEFELERAEQQIAHLQRQMDFLRKNGSK